MNIQTWLALFGTQVLDNYLCICNEEEFAPVDRYCDFKNNFKKHFNLTSFWGSQVGAHFPLLTVEQVENVDLQKCFGTVKIAFTSMFQTISPPCGDGCPCICNSPQCILEYQERVICALRWMFSSWELDKDGKYYERTIASDLEDLIIDGEKFKYPMYIDVVSEEVSKIYTKDEFLYFTYVVELSVGDSNCTGDENW